ncbi:MAG: hypothetical protein D4R48_02000 [Nitrosomonadales bacterium]|nr:MAG: hypothetical protein D4R48_02000 [Nitrosomonadales bacterium]
MINSVTNAPQTQPAARATTENSTTESQESSKSKPQPSNAKTKDTVNISNASLAALKEATETAAQTANEARGGDHQAQRLLAKQAALKAS